MNDGATLRTERGLLTRGTVGHRVMELELTIKFHGNVVLGHSERANFVAVAGAKRWARCRRCAAGAANVVASAGRLACEARPAESIVAAEGARAEIVEVEAAALG